MNQTYVAPEGLLKSKTFNAKTSTQQERILQALETLEALGVPVDDTPRRLEAMALAFLAVANVTTRRPFAKAADVSTWARGTREIIEWQRAFFNETRSLGSYDDIRRRDLLRPALAGIAVQPESYDAKNDPTRGWGLSPDAASVVRLYGTGSWHRAVTQYRKKHPPLDELLTKPRDLPVHSVKVSPGVVVGLGSGGHNELIRDVIQEFLPRFGRDAVVLYVGDASDRMLHIDRLELERMGFYDLEHGNPLPDVIAYSRGSGWLYLIEAVHSVGPVSPEKHLILEALLQDVKVPVVYVTAFASPEKFAKHSANIAWETEVWIASAPDHMIHYNGEKFLGPY